MNVLLVTHVMYVYVCMYTVESRYKNKIKSVHLSH